MDLESSDILGQTTMPTARGGNSQTSSFSTTRLAFYAVSFLAVYALGQRFRKRFLLWRERSYKLATRRRHGIPDDDLRPFNVAYTEAVMRSREEESRKQADVRAPVRPQVGSIDLGEAMPNQNLRLRSVPHSNEPDSRGITGIVPGGYSSRHHEPLHSPRSVHDQPINSLVYAPSTSSNRRLSRHSARLDLITDSEAKKRGWDEDEDEEHEVKKSRVEGEELIDGYEDAEFDETVPKRGSKRLMHDDDEDDVDETKVSNKSRGKRARKVSNLNGHHGYQVDDNMNVDSDDEEMDDITDLKPISRGKKRDRAEAGSTFGGDDDDSGAEHEGDSKHRRRRRKRRTVSKRKSEATHIRDKKRLRDIDEDLSEGSEGSSPSKVSSHTRKRGKRTSFIDHSEYEHQKNDVSMDDSMSSLRNNIREIGEEWENNGVRWKVGPNGQRLRLALVKKARQRFVMPKDSQHPDREANMQICVETWLTEEEYQQAKADHALAWQDSPKQNGERLSLDISNGVPFPQQAPGKNLLWSTSATSTPTMSPASHSPSEGTPEVYQPRLSHSSYRHSLGGSTGLPGSTFGNSGMPTVKRISSTSRALSLSGSLSGPFGASVNGMDSPITDSTNASPRSPAPKVFSKWEKQELEAKAIMKVREANKKKEMEREAKVKAEKDAKERLEREKAAAAEKVRLEKEKAERERLERAKAEREKKEKEAAAAAAQTTPSSSATPSITVTAPTPVTLTGTGGGAVPNTFFNSTKPAQPSSVPNFFVKTAEPPKPATTPTVSFNSNPTATPAVAPASSPFSFPASTTATSTTKKDVAPTAAPPTNTGFFSSMAPTPPVEQSKAAPSFSFNKPTAAPPATSGAIKFNFSGGTSSTPAPATSTSGTTLLGGPLAGSSDTKTATNGSSVPLFNFTPTSVTTATGGPSSTGTAFSLGTKEAPKNPFGNASTTFGTSKPASSPFSSGAAATPSPFGNTTTTTAFGKPNAPFGTAAATPALTAGTSGSTTTPSPFGAPTPNPFGTTPTAKPDGAPTFSFAAPSSTSASAPSTAAAPSAPSTFTFGAPKVTTPATGAPTTTFKFGPPSGSSLFGGNSATSAAPSTAPTSSAPAPIFSFGASSQK